VHASAAPDSERNVDVYSVTRIWTSGELKRLSTVWNSLLDDAAPSPSIFLTWQWLESWVECFLTDERRLFVLCVNRGEEVIAIAPWYVEPRRRGPVTLREVRFLGSPESGSDYLDVILKEGKERVAAEALYDFLFGPGRHDWDELRLSDVPAESRFLLHFLNIVEAHGKFVELRRHAYLPQVALPDTYDAFFATLSSHRRSRIRQDLRRLGKEGEFAHATYAGDDIDAGLHRFFALYDEMSGYQDGPTLSRFLRTLATRRNAGQWVEIDLLCVGGRDVCALLHLRFGQHISLLKMVADKTFSRRMSIGNLLVGMSIRRLIEQGADSYDFLKGDEDYKFHWARHGRTTVSIVIPRRHWKAVVLTAYRLLKYSAKTILR